MTRRIPVWLVVVVLCASTLSFADFKYSETSKITGGAIQGAMKFAGVFSKQAREANKPSESTIYIKGDRLRTDHSDGSIEIIDLVKQPQLAKGDQILAVPTLVRKLPVPMRKIIGDLSNTDRVLVGLDLRARSG